MKYHKSRKGWIIVLMVFLAMSFACAQSPDDEVIIQPSDPPLTRVAGDNLTLFHATATAAENSLCIACHGDRSGEVAPGNPSIATPHNIHTVKVGLICVDCHQSTDFLQKSGAQLRHQVSTVICANCHGNVLFPGL